MENPLTSNPELPEAQCMIESLAGWLASLPTSDCHFVEIWRSYSANAGDRAVINRWRAAQLSDIGRLRVSQLANVGALYGLASPEVAQDAAKAFEADVGMD